MGQIGTPTRPLTRLLTFRHSAWVRATHWISVVLLTGLLLSGLQIFNAHPTLYIGKASDFDHPILQIGTDGSETKGQTILFGHAFNTTGVLGLSAGQEGNLERAFPRWITLPADQDLATGRRWHFLFAWLLVANGFIYLAYGFASGHLGRDIWPRLHEFRTIPHSIFEHVRLRFPKGEAARHYNILQKITYALVLFGVLPILVLAGMTMSPALDSIFPWLLEFFGGRQTARTIHFLMATLLVLFVLVHVAMVIVSGVWNNLRSMITGRYAIDVETPR